MVFLFILIVAPSVNASSEDTQQPITIEADHAELDEKKETSIYTGNVLLRQGGIVIKANTVTVYTHKGELQRITAEGNPVKYHQSRDNQEDIEGVSLRMEYETVSKKLLLLDDAELWQGKNRFSGERIQFDPEKEKVIASGGGEGKTQGSKRVQITLQPKSREQESQKQQPDSSAGKP